MLLACVAEAQIASGTIDEQAEAGLERAIEIAANQHDLRVLPNLARVRALLAKIRGDTEGFTQRMQEASALYRAVHETWLADQIDEQLEAARQPACR